MQILILFFEVKISPEISIKIDCMVFHHTICYMGKKLRPGFTLLSNMSNYLQNVGFPENRDMMP